MSRDIEPIAGGMMSGGKKFSETFENREAIERHLRRTFETFNVRTTPSPWLRPNDKSRMLDTNQLLGLGAVAGWTNIHVPIRVSDGYYATVHSFGVKILLDQEPGSVRIRLLRNGKVFGPYGNLFMLPPFANVNQLHRSYGMHLNSGETFVLQAQRVGGVGVVFLRPSYYAWEWPATKDQELASIT
jgi:hypothetical protein